MREPSKSAAASASLEGHAPVASSWHAASPVAALRKALASIVAWWLNPPARAAPTPVDLAVQALHRRIPVADLHSDCLLWGRDLLQRSRIGHVDLPRLTEGGVALQVFSVVTHTPRRQNLDCNDASTDNITLLAALQGWPRQVRASRFERALYQAKRLEELERRSGGRLKIIRHQRDLAQVQECHSGPEPVVGALLSLEGAHALEGHLDNLDRLFQAGFRMMAPSHFFDTDIGGSAHGVQKGGLTELGRLWLARMEELRILIDLAHASPRTVDEVLALATRPLVVSHTGVQGTCANSRNLSDDHLRGIAARGGIIGIGFWKDATGGEDVAAVVRAIEHAVAVAGVDHVALGSDFDGAVRTAVDATQLPQITAALLKAGLNEGAVAKIMGANVFRLCARALPQ